MDAPELKTEHYTYADYVTWPEDERWEIIEGQAYAMTPSPTWEHQAVQAAIIAQLWIFFEGKPCRVLGAPLDTILPRDGGPDETADTVVQPDVLVVCDEAKLEKTKRVRGMPDLVVEILSESTSGRDMGIKLRLYEKHGVRCYIIADPWGKTLTVRYLEPDGKFGTAEFYTEKQRLPVRIFEGLELDLPRIFANI